MLGSFLVVHAKIEFAEQSRNRQTQFRQDLILPNIEERIKIPLNQITEQSVYY